MQSNMHIETYVDRHRHRHICGRMFQVPLEQALHKCAISISITIGVIVVIKMILSVALVLCPTSGLALSI